MKKIYNIVFCSDVGGGTSVSENFFFDWGQIEDVPYKVSFSFQCGGATLSTDVYSTLVFIDLGQTNNFIAQAQTGAQPNYRGGLLGSLQISGIGADCYYYANIDSNPATLIYHRPSSNNFTIHLHQNTPNFSTSATWPPGPYTLILNLETLD